VARKTEGGLTPLSFSGVIDHVTIRVADRAASVRFYDTVLAVLGLERDHDEWGDFSLYQDTRTTKNLHIAFFAPTTDLVDAFHAAGVQAGYQDDGAPGARPQYGPDYYGGFLRDPDGNSVEAVTSIKSLPSGAIDHLWLRSNDLDAAKRFYTTIGPCVGLGLGDDERDRKQFITTQGTFSFVAPGAPTEHVHLAFGVRSNAEVDAFHKAATEAGYEDNGAPGERAAYHPGYYGAFVLDPDGHNIEAVNHNR
jgi:catechol 2,3-dioxygenase-like lactoylglutathione lyase family enzyme